MSRRVKLKSVDLTVEVQKSEIVEQQTVSRFVSFFLRRHIVILLSSVRSARLQNLDELGGEG